MKVIKDALFTFIGLFMLIPVIILCVLHYMGKGIAFGTEWIFNKIYDWLTPKISS